MKIIVAYSGGKDSQASLIWAVKQYGADKITAVFCDTGWEHPVTYKHINDTCKDLNVELITVKSKKYYGMEDLVKKKGRWPSSQRRFCTENLKSIPFIDYILDEVKDHVLVLQGIRAEESASRSKMKDQCKYFKFYFEPYGYVKSGKNKGKPKYHTHRKKDVFEYCKSFADDILRPVFDWTAQQVIDYIIENGQQPNPLYKEGFARVGCFPCMLCKHNELLQISKRYPERIKHIESIENETGSTFFSPDKIPDWYKKEVDDKYGSGVKIAGINRVVQYIQDKNATLDMFEGPTSCMSFYSLCE